MRKVRNTDHIQKITTAKFYKESFLKTQPSEPLYKFKVELSKIFPGKKDFEDYYFIDRFDQFWLSESFHSLVLDTSDSVPGITTKHINSEHPNKQIKMALWKSFYKCKPEFQTLLDIILSNVRHGTPRKAYRIPDIWIKIDIVGTTKQDKELASKLPLFTSLLSL